MQIETLKKLEDVRKSILILDIETSGLWDDGSEIDINTNFEEYVEKAKCKFIGMYSYKFNEYNGILITDNNKELIKKYIEKHDIIVGFNSDEFDIPILYNNGLMPEDKNFLLVDCLIILGSSTFARHDGLSFKNRGVLMGYKPKKNSLKCWAEVMELETQKGDIDYKIFHKDSWSDDEIIEIKRYLKSDVMATKEMFNKLWDFWYPFTEFLDEKNILNLSWIKSSIASLRYKGDCHTLGVEETYGEPSEKKEEMGGNVIDPKYEEARNVIYLDFSSLYPWIRNMFCIDNEIKKEDINKYNNVFHGNDMFQVKGYYDISHQSPITLKSINNLSKRSELKKNNPDDPMIYTIKIYENAGYGALRSPIFEQIHTPNAGWDICWLGQQFQKIVEKEMLKYGFETIAGDTDSVFVKSIERDDIDTYVKSCLKKILKKIMKYIPYPSEVFNIDIEEYIEYIMWNFDYTPVIDLMSNKKENIKIKDKLMSEELQKAYILERNPNVNIDNVMIPKGRSTLVKEYKGKKKNYIYLYKKNNKLEICIKGLPIKKDNATLLGKKIYKEQITKLILKEKTAKFPKEIINNILADELKKIESVKLLAREFKVKPSSSYKPNKDGTDSTNIYAQISRGYFNGGAGVINLIKNKKIGKVGKTTKYCTVDEFVINNLSLEHVDLTKIQNELKPFIEKG